MKKKLLKKKKRKGFTLIELLAVILILGIIALIAIPTVSSVVEQSRRGSKIETARQLVKAAEQYSLSCDLGSGYDSKGNECVKNIKEAEEKGYNINDILDLKGDTLSYEDIHVFEISDDGKVKINYSKDGYSCSNFFDKKNNVVYDMNKAVDFGDDIDCSKDELYKEKVMYDLVTFSKKSNEEIIEGGMFHDEVYSTKIISVSMVYYIDLTDAVVSWNITKDGSDNVVAWLEANGEYYDLYIGSEGTIAPTSLMYFFANLENVKTIDLYNLDTSRTTTFNNMFRRNYNVETIEFGKINTSNVKSTYGMFIHCKKLKKLDLSSWDMSNVTNAGYMFFEDNSVTELILGDKFTMENATNMTRMFYNMKQMKKFDLRVMNVSKNADFFFMFGLNRSLEELDISTWNTSSATTMTQMFYADEKLTNIYVGPNFKLADEHTDYLYKVPEGAIKLKN